MRQQLKNRNEPVHREPASEESNSSRYYHSVLMFTKVRYEDQMKVLNNKLPNWKNNQRMENPISAYKTTKTLISATKKDKVT